MKIAHYEQMMDYLTGPRERFRSGGIAKPKRGLVDEPGSYSKPSKEMEKIAQKNIAAWKKANPDLNYEDLKPEAKTRARAGNISAGTFTKRTKLPGVYSVKELAELENMPFGEESLKKYLSGKKDNNIKTLIKEPAL